MLIEVSLIHNMLLFLFSYSVVTGFATEKEAIPGIAKMKIEQVEKKWLRSAFNLISDLH